MGLSFNKAEFARLIGKSPRWITKLITEEGLPVESGGGKGKAVIIDSDVGINWLIKEAVAKAVGMREGDEDEAGELREGTKAYEDYHLQKAKRIQEQVKAKQAEQTSIELEDLKPILFEIANIYGQQLDSIGGRVATEFSSINDPAIIKSRMLEESRRIRGQTADRIIAFCTEYRGNVSADSECTTAEGS